MEYIKVYEYNTKEEAQLDINKIDVFLGLPKNSGAITYDEAIEKDGKWYFRSDYFTDEIISKTPIEINY